MTTSPVSVSTSVIVSINPHENELEALLAAYAVQTPVPGGFELVVVDSGAREDVAAACATFSGERAWRDLRRVISSRPGRGACNNVGVAAATGDLLVFVADDFVPTRNLVRAHRDFHTALAAPGVGIGGGFFTDASRTDPFRQWLEDSGTLYGFAFASAGLRWPTDFFYSGNASMQRDLFERVGRFDPDFDHDTLDDLEFGRRLHALGVPTHYLPKARAWHDHRVTLEERSQVMRVSGFEAVRLEQRQPGAWPWAKLVARPLAELAAAARAHPEGPDRYRALLDLAFVTGYQQARRAEPGRVLPFHAP